MQQELMHRIRLQDTDFTMKDLKTVRVIGAGAAGVVRLVMNKKTGMRPGEMEEPAWEASCS